MDASLDVKLDVDNIFISILMCMSFAMPNAYSGMRHLHFVICMFVLFWINPSCSVCIFFFIFKLECKNNIWIIGFYLKHYGLKKN
jgi:hypothetical protein